MLVFARKKKKYLTRIKQLKKNEFSHRIGRYHKVCRYEMTSGIQILFSIS